VTDHLQAIVDGLGRLADRPVVTRLDPPTESVTGAGLLRRAAAVRRVLDEAGVGPGDRVALVAGPSAAWIACDLAVLAHGAVLVPFDVRTDAAALADLVADCAPALALADDPAVLPEGAPARALADAAAGDAEWPGRVVVPATDPATIIYTSGSSGRPKGAVLTHANLSVMLDYTTARLEQLSGRPFGEDRALHYLPPCYAGSRVLLHSCLRRGALVQLVGDPRRLGEHLAAADADYFLNVPLVLERFRRAATDAVRSKSRTAGRLLAEAEAAWARREEHGGRVGLRDRLLLAVARWLVLKPIRARFGSRLRGVICGSAPLAAECQRFFHLLGVDVYQGYGLTETTALCTLDEPERIRPGWVGPAMPFVELRRADDGELLTRGPHVFPGYWRDEAATRVAIDGDGWLHTGDLGEVDAEGRWRITGRKSAVLVLQTGHNVAPEPLEAGLREALGGDAQVCLVGHGRPSLAAVVAGERLARPEVAAALEAVNAGAPSHRQVRHFHLHPEPLTPESGLLTTNLKLRRRAIAERFASELEALYACAARPATEPAAEASA